ncbi:MAG: AMP-binding protein [Actinomycetota bacterium]|nr:AMP-binding protein [Actinomycetota bacterium]
MPGLRNNVADLVREAAQRDPDHLALVSDATGRLSSAEPERLTWAELDDRVDAVASALAARGLRPGDRVALRMANSLHFPVAYFAILRAGLVVLPVNPDYTARELGHILSDSGARLMITGPELPEPIGLEEHPYPQEMEVLLDLPGHDRPPESQFEPVGGGEDLAVLMYTSGTTGVPKGAMLPHRALLANLIQCSLLRPAPMAGTDVVLLALPLFHIYGLNAALGMIARTGATGVLMERFDVAASLSLMADQHVTNVPGAPPMYVAWLARADRGHLARAFADVRLATSGAAALPADALEAMRGLGVAVHEGYGLTETAPVLSSTLTTGRVKAGSIGQAIPNVELRLADEGPRHDGDPTTDAKDPDDPFDDPEEEAGATGEIMVRGDNLFLGYWPDGSGGPDADGWFSTGDVAYRDTDGDLHLVDRSRDLILVSGFNVYPREVELVLAGHPQIEEAAVLGVRNPATGEGVRAVVVLSEGAELTEAQVCQYAATQLARFKCPTSVEIVDQLPRSVTGKISKARLRELGFADIRPT